MVAKSTFSSCSPNAAFVAGVKIGSGSREPSTSPSGSGTPHTERLCWYSSQPGPGEVAAGHALDGHHVEPLAHDRPAEDLLRHVVVAQHVVLDDVVQLREPPLRQLREHRALVGHEAVEHEVEGADPVGGHHQQPVALALRQARRVQLAHLADVDQGQVAAPTSAKAAEEGTEGDPGSSMITPP